MSDANQERLERASIAMMQALVTHQKPVEGADTNELAKRAVKIAQALLWEVTAAATRERETAAVLKQPASPAALEPDAPMNPYAAPMLQRPKRNEDR